MEHQGSINLFFVYKHADILVVSLRKGKNGYSNHGLLTILRDATDHVAGTPGAGGIALCMKSYQTKIIQRAREWNVCSLNEFRRSLGLEREYNHLVHSSTLTWSCSFRRFQAVELQGGSIQGGRKALQGYRESGALCRFSPTTFHLTDFDQPGLQAEKSNSDSGFALGSTMVRAPCTITDLN